ncbi:TetR/AcrR family transcriptional regulator [Streptomyces sp. NPDC007346]|uniref:TetR/AcrR family transcriptional regulator n=1 Tax=Streptomyces sp. NPDC007346 TaxID=3154682 RepID=UPI003455118D
MPESKARKGATGEGAASKPPADGAADRTAGGLTEAARPRRRQARGEARIAQLLQAAARVFSASGYTASSTNAIAREAGVSPGTLYQFFPNKEAIAVELGDQLLHHWGDTYGAAFTPSHMELPLDRMLDAVLDPLIAFNCENPAFFALMHGSEVPGRITEAHDTVHATMLTRVEEILLGYLPDAPADQVHRVADMAFMAFKAGLDLIMAHEGEERDAYIRELKALMFRYLDPLIGDDSPHLAPHARQGRTPQD